MQHIVSVLTAGALLLCASPVPAALDGTVTIDGSSTVYPISEAVGEEFQRANPKTRVTIGIAGTGGGFQRFCNGEIDVANASRPITPVEVEACKGKGVEYIELPVAYDGLAVVVHPTNTWADCITTKELATLWAPAAQKTVTRWNQVRSAWPDKEIRLFGAGTDSGTYDYFAEAIVGKNAGTRGDFQASEDDNVLVQGVASDPLALGFFGLAYYEENMQKLKLLAVDDENPANGAGCIRPTLETVGNGTYQPLSRPLFLYVKKAAADRPVVNAFVSFYLEQAATLAKEVGYIPFPHDAYALLRKRFESRTTGTIFGASSSVGVTITELLKREQ
ncbi:MAG TPA: PstS family phosphate ABC transporter substrate-binding protein [Candidatus Limnocylindria bacterium]|nr:PstS family phosphate ABC transporter substrate-binding protein [Candidatus Limnocylindria bacterium]